MLLVGRVLLGRLFSYFGPAEASDPIIQDSFHLILLLDTSRNVVLHLNSIVDCLVDAVTSGVNGLSIQQEPLTLRRLQGGYTQLISLQS